MATLEDILNSVGSHVKIEVLITLTKRDCVPETWIVRSSTSSDAKQRIRSSFVVDGPSVLRLPCSVYPGKVESSDGLVVSVVASSREETCDAI